MFLFLSPRAFVSECVWLCLSVFSFSGFLCFSPCVCYCLCVCFLYDFLWLCVSALFIFFLSLPGFAADYVLLFVCVCVVFSVPVCLTVCVCLCVRIYVDICLCFSVCSRVYLISPMCAFVFLSDTLCLIVFVALFQILCGFEFVCVPQCLTLRGCVFMFCVCLRAYFISPLCVSFYLSDTVFLIVCVFCISFDECMWVSLCVWFPSVCFV